MLNTQDFDERRSIACLGAKEEAIDFAAEHWIHTAQRAIQRKGRFAVALSGGSTPKSIYQNIAQKHRTALPWDKVFLFWSDERAVPPTHPDSNYKMAIDAGFDSIGIPASQIFRMHGEGNLEKNAIDYEDAILRVCDKDLFDLVMLGVGEDGHTASLFPGTAALQETKRLVVSNRVSEKTSRLTLTFPCIERSKLTAIYAFGEAKASIVFTVLNAPLISPFPASRLGSPERKALWILDRAAAKLLN